MSISGNRISKKHGFDFIRAARLSTEGPGWTGGVSPLSCGGVSSLWRGVISILRLQAFVAESAFWKIAVRGLRKILGARLIASEAKFAPRHARSMSRCGADCSCSRRAAAAGANNERPSSTKAIREYRIQRPPVLMRLRVALLAQASWSARELKSHLKKSESPNSNAEIPVMSATARLNQVPPRHALANGVLGLS